MLAECNGANELLVNGRKMRNHHDFCTIIKNGPWDSKMRGMVHFAQDGMWESNNSWSLNLEEEFATMMGITWLGKNAFAGHVEKRNTQGNCAHHLFVKNKTSLVTRFRNTTRRKWLEAIYARQRVKKEKLHLKPTNIPVVVGDYIKASYGESGFNGWIGYCEGHKYWNDTAVPTVLVPAVSAAAPVDPMAPAVVDPVAPAVVDRRDDELEKLKAELAAEKAKNIQLEKNGEFVRIVLALTNDMQG